ncbi:hypothetical protein LguiB_030841 [Lonicera macranthoides]
MSDLERIYIRSSIPSKNGEGKLARFNQMKTKNGFPRLISQAVFNDASNGYLVDDTCIFGAEVFVIKNNNNRKVESLSAAGYLNHPNGVYAWIVSDFSNMNLERDNWSPVFSAAGKKWKIRISSTKKRGKKYLSLHLYSANTQTNFLDFNFLSWFRRHNRETFSQGGDFYVEYIIRVRDQLHEEHEIGKACCWFYAKSSNIGYGFKYFMPLEDLKDPPEGFLLNDSVVIDVEFNLVREVKNILDVAPFDNEM